MAMITLQWMGLELLHLEIYEHLVLYAISKVGGQAGVEFVEGIQFCCKCNLAFILKLVVCSGLASIR